MTNLPENVTIIGAGGHAKVVIAALEAAGRPPAYIFDDAAAEKQIEILDHAISAIPQSTWWQQDTTQVAAHIAIGSNTVRKKIAQTTPADAWATIVHPTAIVHPSAQIGAGVFVSARAVIQPDAKIGAHTIINTGAIIEHDCVVGDYCHIAPSVTLCGNTRVGEGTLVGVGSSTIPGIRIGAWAAVGASSTVVSAIGDNEVAFGSPARAHRRNDP